MYRTAPPTPPRLSALWEAIRDRLAGDAALEGLLGGAGRVSISTEEPFVGPESQQWQRAVVVPVTRAYPVEDDTGASILAPFLVRFDSHVPGKGVPVSMLELLHIRALTLLHGWLPVGLADVAVFHRVWRTTTPPPIPLPDPERDVFFSSAEYRVLAESPDFT